MENPSFESMYSYWTWRFSSQSVYLSGLRNFAITFSIHFATIFSIVAFGSSNSTAFIVHHWEWMHIQLSCYKVRVPDLPCYFQTKYRVSHQRTQRGEGTLDQKLWSVTCFGSLKGRWGSRQSCLALQMLWMDVRNTKKLVGEWDHEVFE